MPRLIALVAILYMAPALALAQTGNAGFEGRLKKIQATKTISVAYRTDALPFSFEDDDKQPAGYMVELYRSVISAHWALRYAVNAALTQIYRSNALMEIYNRWLGGLGKPSPALQMMYELGRLPE